jgi:tetratricopeptide (TPR) repeat protein
MALLLTLCFSLAARLQVWYQEFEGNRSGSSDVLEVAMGDARRLFANHSYVKADVYFHSGYYPSIFDQAVQAKPSHMASNASEESAQGEPKGKKAGEEDPHDDLPEFLNQPTDWIDRFGRNFIPTTHEHNDDPKLLAEMMPWLRLAAELDPDRPQIYAIAAFWLRTRLGKVDEAEAFLRLGWRNNPESFEILFELGRLFNENRNDIVRARHCLEGALKFWEKSESKKTEPDRFAQAQILASLIKLEEGDGRLEKAILRLKQLQKISPFPQDVQKRIDELTAKLPPNANPSK